MLSLKDGHRSAVSIAAEIEEVGSQPVSAQIIRCTSNWCAWLLPEVEASSEDDTQESLQTVC